MRQRRDWNCEEIAHPESAGTCAGGTSMEIPWMDDRHPNPRKLLGLAPALQQCNGWQRPRSLEGWHT